MTDVKVRFTKNVKFHSKDQKGKNVVKEYKKGEVVNIEELPHKDVGSFAERYNEKKADKNKAEAKAKAEKEAKEKAEAEAKAKAEAKK